MLLNSAEDTPPSGEISKTNDTSNDNNKSSTVESPIKNSFKMAVNPQMHM